MSNHVKYNRIFARIFYDSAGGRVSDEEFLPLWEREEEIRQGLSRIQSLEGEKKQIEKEISVQEDEERDLKRKEREFHGKFINRRAYFLSSLIMALTAAGLGAAAVFYFELRLSVSLAGSGSSVWCGCDPSDSQDKKEEGGREKENVSYGKKPQRDFGTEAQIGV